MEVLKYFNLCQLFFTFCFNCLNDREVFFHTFKSLTFFPLADFIILRKTESSPASLLWRQMISYLELASGLFWKSRCAMSFHGPWSFIWSRSRKEAATCRSSVFLSVEISVGNSAKKEISRILILVLLSVNWRRFPEGVAYVRGGIHGSDADGIPPWVFTVHQWTRGVALIKNNIAVTAAAAPGNDGTATARPRRRISGARTPAERPAI